MKIQRWTKKKKKKNPEREREITRVPVGERRKSRSLEAKRDNKFEEELKSVPAMLFSSPNTWPSSSRVISLYPTQVQCYHCSRKNFVVDLWESSLEFLINCRIVLVGKGSKSATTHITLCSEYC